MIKIVGDPIYSALGKWPSRKWNLNIRRNANVFGAIVGRVLTDNSLHKRPHVFVADRLDNIPRPSRSTLDFRSSVVVTALFHLFACYRQNSLQMWEHCV